MPFIRQTFMMPLIRQIIIKIEYHNRSCWMRFTAYCFRQRRQPGDTFSQTMNDGLIDPT